MPENEREYTILITDDEKLNLYILGGILSPTYNILVSRSGARALEIAKNNRPDLILLDVIMPDMSGFEVIEKLKASELTAKIPVIFITGLSDVADEERGFFLGAVDYIAKPFNKAIIKARVNTHIRILDQMRTIEQIGLIDPLTRVENRRGFETRICAEWGRSMREQTPVAMLMMDIDRFKDYNDTYGHQQGDAVLKAFTDTVSKSLLRSVDSVARWGGEEFVILLPDTGADGAAEVAERVRANVEALDIATEDGSVTKITVSIGVHSIVPTADDSIKECIEKADQALYKAKQAGRNRVVTSSD